MANAADNFLSGLNDATNFISGVQGSLAGNADQIISNQDYEGNGFVVKGGVPTADGNGLPSSKVRSQRTGTKSVRNIIHWFVPEFGVVKMYVNPQSIQYNYKKIIQKTQTKGGFVIQYWGEELPTLNIQGVTGSSGVEGMNVLYEVYRAEQYSFDSIGLSLAANANVSGSQNLIDKHGDAMFGADSLVGDLASEVTGGLFGSDPTTSLPIPQNIPTLASLALGIEMFYNGWVFRGFFENLTITETAGDLGNFAYTMQFVVTQRRGYRTNYMGWHRSAIDGPSNNGVAGIPLSFNR